MTVHRVRPHPVGTQLRRFCCERTDVCVLTQQHWASELLPLMLMLTFPTLRLMPVYTSQAQITITFVSFEGQRSRENDSLVRWRRLKCQTSLSGILVLDSDFEESHSKSPSPTSKTLCETAYDSVRRRIFGRVKWLVGPALKCICSLKKEINKSKCSVWLPLETPKHILLTSFKYL